MSALRILIADDHEVVRQGMRTLLSAQPGWQVCAEAATGREAVTKARLLHPAVAVLDISMPDLNGLEATRQIRRESPTTEVLILTVHEAEQLVREILDAGAQGYVLKSDAGRELVNAVTALSQHKPYFSSSVARIVLDGYLKGQRRKPLPAEGKALTPREREIVQLLAEGKSNKEIAKVLGISVTTAETHRAHVLQKLRLHSIADLVRYAIRNNIIEP